ncbi:MAG: trmD [Chlamydiales bacterium]|jgi:tRNA (guanine37-N1)-methyltransferase|nr:trmD [Chlamydiales bacterium]
MRIDIVSLFPNYFQGPFDESIIRRAKQQSLIDINLVNIRNFADNKHNRVDDRPFGGGPGMVLMAPPVVKALDSVRSSQAKVIYLSPQGAVLTAQKCQQLALDKHLILLCGHYEGIDQRVVDHYVDEEISIGDYVLTNGCLAAIVLVDSVVRFIPGVLGDERAAEYDSFQKGILDCPHYTVPLDYNGHLVPDELRLGNHKHIEAWRHAAAIEKTARNRPDLMARYILEQQSSDNNSETDQSLALDEKQIQLHATLFVRQLQESLRFYRRLLRFEVIEKSEGKVILTCGIHKIQLIEKQFSQEDNLNSRQEAIWLEVEVKNSLYFQTIAKNLVSLQQDGISRIDHQAKAIYCRDPDAHNWCFYLKQG